ncbi:tRNA(Met) cytidine acetyltransferase TmcA [Larsenimonas rhizosphaerae]|uniref:tRNA(Met) cytidine acetyltransferase TmcA n=1 Tax=Larsenimonas rhizosphaerae TaxID=2944682 RepID=UPI0020332302|nr:GNAT family N-acetyltransferase [Larsenimonas rhizosphaerae]
MTSDLSAPFAALTCQRRVLAARRHRALMCWQGTPVELVARARQYLADQGDVLWVSPTPPEAIDVPHCRPGRARAWLGRERDIIVMDATEVFDPEALGALSGTVRAGGVLLLLLSETFGQTPDDGYARLADWPWEPASLSSRFLARCARLLESSAASFAIPERDIHQGVTEHQRHTESGVRSDGSLTDDQTAVVNALIALKRRRPLVITADRGRGKSASLGLAAARLLAGGQTTLFITAPAMAAIEPVFDRLAEQLPDGHRDGTAFLIGEQRLQFLAPDQLAASGGPGTTLFVDEAAALPVQVLTQALEAFPRIAFATTVHGYEGSGRGFELRFRSLLDRRAPQWRAMTMTSPVRWAEGDPLEQLTHRLLLLDAEPTAPGESGEPVRVVVLDRKALARDEDRLAEVFGLLVQAHYRTSPADLRQLLDGPGIEVRVALEGEQVIGVLVSLSEGGFDAPLAEQIARGERRPQGHLVAQSLTLHLGEAAAAQVRWRRIMRVAVHPARRRRGVGRQLVEALAADAGGAALLGVSFGLDDTLPAFWQTLGFTPVRVGLTRETASGEHALMMARPLTADGNTLRARLAARFSTLLPDWLARELVALDPAQAAGVLAGLPTPSAEEGDAQRLDRFISANAPWALSRPVVQKAVWQVLACHGLVEGSGVAVGLAFQSMEAPQPLLARLLPAEASGVTGRRRWLARWLSQWGSEQLS